MSTLSSVTEVKTRSYIVEWREMPNKVGKKRVRGMIIMPCNSGRTTVQATSTKDAQAAFRSANPNVGDTHFIIDSIGLDRDRVHD